MAKGIVAACPPGTGTAEEKVAACSQGTEYLFLNLLRNPGIDSWPGGLVQQPYLPYRPARLHRLAEAILSNQFLFLTIY
jgi:hypothetical protein